MEVCGVDSAEFLETVSPVDLQKMNEGTGMMLIVHK